MRLYDGRPSGTVGRARQLRRDAPEPERRLLRVLKAAFPTLKWRHQAPIGPFYADILCFSERLVIEVDGDTHANAEARDEGRSAFIASEGFRVIRYANADVMQNSDGVIANVGVALKAKGSAV
ncbi:endonuclease domain-containing protein [Sphingomonas floccifaciens]|uniref:Endonuclease domain-containing protein n=1 Tax=Sphingomonas floccifaciens TaxID=1844115 RepID=A0ABW4ND03_9SPHN